MSIFYLDASAVVNSLEPGSDWIRSLTAADAGHTIILSEITLAEVAAALAAKHRAPGGITRDERDKALGLFLSHCETDYILVSVDRSVIERAVYLTQQHPLRGYDAVQLASAIAANEALRLAGLMPLIFVAADLQLLAAARAEGLRVENPAEIGRMLCGSR